MLQLHWKKLLYLYFGLTCFIYLGSIRNTYAVVMENDVASEIDLEAHDSQSTMIRDEGHHSNIGSNQDDNNEQLELNEGYPNLHVLDSLLNQPANPSTVVHIPDASRMIRELHHQYEVKRINDHQRDIEKENCKREVKNARELQKHKDRFERLYKKQLMKADKKVYNQILGVVAKILQPINDRKKRARGGIARVEVAMGILQELLHIHRNEELGSQLKHAKLNVLMEGTRQTLDNLQRAEKLPLDFPGSWRQELVPTLELFKQQLLAHSVIISSVGGNVACQLVILPVGVGVGGCVGASKDVCGGKRRGVLVGQGVSSFMLGASCAGGYYEFNNECKKGPVFISGESALHGGFIAAATVGSVPPGVSDWEEDFDAGPLYEVGITAGFSALKFFGFVGMELIPFPKRDYKYFRKNVGLTVESGKLPDALVAEIQRVRSKEELRGIDWREYRIVIA